MAAGIYDDQSKLVAGLSISAPADRLEEAWIARLKTAAQISSALGYRGLISCCWAAAAPARAEPLAHALGIGNPRGLAAGIKQHHDQLAPGHTCLHHQALAGLADEAGLCRPMSHSGLPIRPLVLRNCTSRLPSATRA